VAWECRGCVVARLSEQTHQRASVTGSAAFADESATRTRCPRGSPDVAGQQDAAK